MIFLKITQLGDAHCGRPNIVAVGMKRAGCNNKSDRSLLRDRSHRNGFLFSILTQCASVENFARRKTMMRLMNSWRHHVCSVTSDLADLANAAAENATPRDIVRMPTSVAPKRGMFARLSVVITASHWRYIDKKIARYLATTGASGSITDSIEYEIERRFLSNGSRHA